MAKKPAPARKGRARPVKDAEEAPKTEFEVEEVSSVEVVTKPALGIEHWIIFITFAALAAAFLMIRMESVAAFGKGGQHFAALEPLIAAARAAAAPEATLLVKGSRFMRMERIVAALTQKDAGKEKAGVH